MCASRTTPNSGRGKPTLVATLRPPRRKSALRIFIEEILAATTEGSVYVCTLPNVRGQGSIHEIWSRDAAEIEAFVIAGDKEGRATYFCVSSIRGEERRNLRNAVELPFLHSDIDLKDVSLDRDQVVAVLRGLPKPPSRIHLSGNGVHAYWRLDRAALSGDARVSAILKKIALAVAGDKSVTHAAALMRMPGSHNSKRGEWKEVEVLDDSGDRYSLDEMHGWQVPISILPMGKNRPDPFTEYAQGRESKAPINVEERLAAMKFEGPGESSIHWTQLQCTAALLSRGMEEDDVVEKVLAATIAAAPPGSDWNWRKEEDVIRAMCWDWEAKHGDELRSIREAAAAGLPVIRVTGGGIAREVDEAEAALLATGRPIFERSSFLVEPVESVFPAADGKKTMSLSLRPIHPDKLTYDLNKYAATFTRFDARSKKWVVIDPPLPVVATLLRRGEWQFPTVVGVATCPTMRPDGTILDQPGYDPATQLYLRSTVEVGPIGSTRAEAEAALQLYLDLLSEFPFKSDLDRSVGVATMIAPVLRGAYDVAPMPFWAAPQSGTGKSFGVTLASRIATGRRCPVITNPTSEDELRKHLSALVLQGVPMISIDNCSFDLGGDLLCQMTEQTLLHIRILGRSESVECQWRGNIHATGNNVGVKADMVRRSISCQIDAGVEVPEQRNFRQDPEQMIMANRGKYVAAALTIARAWREAGEPRQGGPIASYGLWSRAVRQPLMWLEMEDPVKTMDRSREEDPVRASARMFLDLWREVFGIGEAQAVSDVISRAYADSTLPTSPGKQLFDFLVTNQGERGEINPNRVSRWLRFLERQVHDGKMLDRAVGADQARIRYVLKEVPSGTEGVDRNG